MIFQESFVMFKYFSEYDVDQTCEQILNFKIPLVIKILFSEYYYQSVIQPELEVKEN